MQGGQPSDSENALPPTPAAFSAAAPPMLTLGKTLGPITWPLGSVTSPVRSQESAGLVAPRTIVAAKKSTALAASRNLINLHPGEIMLARTIERLHWPVVSGISIFNPELDSCRHRDFANAISKPWCERGGGAELHSMVPLKLDYYPLHRAVSNAAALHSL
jgi:hypothetical protein